MKDKPWLTYSQLTEDRLVTVRQMLSKARRDVALLHEPGQGDTTWDRGCRAYSRSKFAIREGATHFQWLKPVGEESSLEFTFMIGDIPIKFCRADGDEIPNRYLHQSEPEQTGWLALDFEHPKEVILRMVIKTNANGEVREIVLTELTEGIVTGEYRIPEIVAGIQIIKATQSAGKVLPPASFGLKQNENRKKDKISNDGVS